MPTNTSAATAQVIASLPFADTVDVSSLASTGLFLWYEYTTGPDETAITIYPFPSVGDFFFFPGVNIYTGTPLSLTETNASLDSFQYVYRRPCMAPCLPSTRYFFRVGDGFFDTPPASLTLTVTTAPNLTIPIGSLLISNEVNLGSNPLYPAVVLAPDGTVVRVVADWPAGETGDTLDNNIFCVPDLNHATVNLYDGITPIAQVAGIIASNSREPLAYAVEPGTFYIGRSTPASAETATLSSLSSAGVVGPTTWALPSNFWPINALAISPDETIAYWATTQTSTALHRHDLVNDLPLSDLHPGTALFRWQKDILILPDGSIMAMEQSLTPVALMYAVNIYQIQPDGTVTATHSYTKPATSIDRMCESHTAGRVWVWTHIRNTGGSELIEYSVFTQYNVSDWSVVGTPIQTDAFLSDVGAYRVAGNATLFAPGGSCPVLVFREAIAPITHDVTVAITGVGATGAVGSLGASAPPVPPAGVATARHYLRRLRRSSHIAHEAYHLAHHGFYLDLETGVGLTAGHADDPPVVGADPQVMLRYSDDGGHTWSDEQWVSAGVRGRYAWRAEWRRLGRSRDRVFEVSMSDPVKWVLIGAWLDVERGSS